VMSDEHLMRKETGMRQGAVMMWGKNESNARVTFSLATSLIFI
jgi:hypothetical protein